MGTIDVDWSMRPESTFSGWLDQLQPDGTFNKRWLRLDNGCLCIYHRAPVGCAPPCPALPGGAALIHEIVNLGSRFRFSGGESAPLPDPDAPKATFEIQFDWQDRTMRFRASHAQLQEKWITVLGAGLRSYATSSLMHQGRLTIVDAEGMARESWVSVTHTPGRGGMLRSSLWCSPTIAPNAEGLADTCLGPDGGVVPPAVSKAGHSAEQDLRGGVKEAWGEEDACDIPPPPQWGTPVALPSRNIELDIPSVDELLKLFDLPAMDGYGSKFSRGGGADCDSRARAGGGHRGCAGGAGRIRRGRPPF
eukprot:COSAG05_NODE_3047_length_2386_cov_12.635010_1_plen_306_part_00